MSILPFSFIHKYIKLFIGLSLLAIIAIVAIVIINNSKLNCNNCNVILVSLDTLSALHLPCYGYERNTAPNLCSYAAKNLLFTNSFSQAPITLDSHFSIFTSLYPHTHKMTTVAGPPLEEKYLTLAQSLRNEGYDTVYNGSQTDLHLPLNRGIERGFNVIRGSSNIKTWDESYKILEENSKKNKKTFLFLHTYAVHQPTLTGHKKKHLYTDQKEFTNIPLTVDEYAKITPEYLDFVVQRTEQIIKSNKSDENKFNTERDLRLAKEMKLAKTFDAKLKIYNQMSIPYERICMQNWRAIFIKQDDPAQIEYLRALYDEKINELDDNLKKLFELVENPKYSKNTILIITADHGEEFMEHGKLFHAFNLFTTSTRVPLIIHIPGVKPKTIKEYVQGIDIYPTILSILGLKPKSLIEGIDLTGIIKGNSNATTNKYLLSEFQGNIGVQMENWRFYYNVQNKTPIGLYDLDIDPKEKKNVIQSNKAKLNQYLDLLKTIKTSSN